MLLKRNSLQKCTAMTISRHDIIFHTSVSTRSFYFHSYFWGPFDAIPIVGTAV